MHHSVGIIFVLSSTAFNHLIVPMVLTVSIVSVVFQLRSVAASSLSVMFFQIEICHVDRIQAIRLEDTGRIESIRLNTISTQLTKLKNSQRKLMKFVADKMCSSRIIDDVLNLFNDSGDFYFSPSFNLTLTTQRLYSRRESDVRFFWNRNLLSDLYGDQDKPLPGAAIWILPICQGFVSQKSFNLELGSVLTVTLISRRSVDFAGMRYLRRGINSDGNVANFVETETIISTLGHHLSYVQIRGSVPIFWSQRGYRYRPPLVVDRPTDESFPVFEMHFDKLFKEYGKPVVVVNLVDQTGRELQLADTYLRHVLQLNSADIAYFSFDLHFHCRALKFDKCAISQAMCNIQAQKLGIIDPQSCSPEQLVQSLQILWADNGDAISRQYSGTNALKGDVIRSGQRRLTGFVKDGYSSASRYYLCHTRDAQRQTAIDCLLGNICVAEGSKSLEKGDDELDEDESENIGRLINETVRFVLPTDEILVGGWALVDAENVSDQVDTIFLLTRTGIYIAIYDEDTEKLLELKVMQLSDIVKMEYGSTGKSLRMHLRIYARPNHILTWRAARTRLFNNVAIPLKSPEEADEYILAIGEQIRVVMESNGRYLSLENVGKLKCIPSARTPRPRLTSILYSVFGMRSSPAVSLLYRSPGRAEFAESAKDICEQSKSESEMNITGATVQCVDQALSKMMIMRSSKSNNDLVEEGSSSSNTLMVPLVHASGSDSRLYDKASGIMSKFQRMKLPLGSIPFSTGVHSNGPSSHCFSQYNDEILKARSFIVLL
ncbi:hypothetical protein AB6A40_002033 [Gnathostoma spinigerum]|uniref:SAC domain-containing protein n=1 Tax=Gnathostoma spinigerum TaxID=75299 RepID=A0ABD6EB10_9BILA